jgi:hypothetical protein
MDISPEKMQGKHRKDALVRRTQVQTPQLPRHTTGGSNQESTVDRRLSPTPSCLLEGA